jgi:hypothetical protein
LPPAFNLLQSSALFCRLVQKSEAHPLSLHSFARSLQKPRSVYPPNVQSLLFPDPRTASLFRAFAPRKRSTSPFPSSPYALCTAFFCTKTAPIPFALNHFRTRTQKHPGVTHSDPAIPSRITLTPSSDRSFVPVFLTDHGTRSTDHAPLTPLSATLTKNGGGVPNAAELRSSALSCTLLQKSEAHPLSRQAFAHSFAETGDACPPWRET